MKLGIISDIHANFEALRSLADNLKAVDQVLCLGDIVGYYCEPKEVIDFLRDINALCLLGNHDFYVLHGCPPDLPPAVKFGIDFANQVLNKDERSWLASLPTLWGGNFHERSFLLSHGSPWDPLGDYLYADSGKLHLLDDFDFDLIAFGQTHRPLQRLERRPLLINPGSVGQPRDQASMASVVVLDTVSLATTSIRRAFDSTHVIGLARSHGAGDWVTKHLVEPAD
jgi:putative phosphoesterase